MARGRLWPLAPRQLSEFRGGFVLADTRHGPVFRGWPKRRVQNWSPYEKYKNTEFGLAAIWASSPFTLDLQTAINLSRGTEWVPRDLLMRAAYGTLYDIVLEDGTRLVPSREVENNPQLMLDLITETWGSIIYRTDVGWVGLDPGSDGQILALDDGLPTWVDIETNGGNGGVPIYPPFFGATATTQNASVNFCQGAPVLLHALTEVNAIQFFCHTTAATPKLTPVIYGRTGNTLGALLASGPQVTGVTQGIVTLPLTTAYTPLTTDIVYAGAQILTANVQQASGSGVVTWSFASSGTIPDPAPATSFSVGNAVLHCWLAKV